jgi:hypothetical protein
MLRGQGSGQSTMNDKTRPLDQNEEDLLIYEISDEAVETAACAGNEKAGIFTQWICLLCTFAQALRRM